MNTKTNRIYSDDRNFVWCYEHNNGEGAWLPVEEFYEERAKCRHCYSEEQSYRMSNSLTDRLRWAQKAQKSRNGLGYLEAEDDLTVQDIFDLLFEQNGYCACPGCDKHFDLDHIKNFEIAHITSPADGGHLTRNNIQLVCHEHNARGKSKFSFTQFLRGKKDDNGNEYGVIVHGLK